MVVGVIETSALEEVVQDSVRSLVRPVMVLGGLGVCVKRESVLVLEYGAEEEGVGILLRVTVMENCIVIVCVDEAF